VANLDRQVTDRILAATVLFHKQTEVMLRDCWSSADLAHEPVDALLSHAVPDQSGTRRVVIEEGPDGVAVLLGLVPDSGWETVTASDGLPSLRVRDDLYRLSPLPEKDPTDG